MLIKLNNIFGIVILLITISALIILVLRFHDCVNSESSSVFVPSDSSFAHVVKSNHRPASLPAFLERTSSKPPTRLPKGVPESDVKSVLIVVKSIPLNDSTTHRLIDSTAIITTKDGSIYIDTAQVKSVEMIAYEEPILRFGSFISLGVSMSLQHITLAVAISPLQICGVVQFPFLALDTEGVGAGIAARTREISFGLLYHQPLTGNRQLKLSITYNL